MHLSSEPLEDPSECRNPKPCFCSQHGRAEAELPRAHDGLSRYKMLPMHRSRSGRHSFIIERSLEHMEQTVIQQTRAVRPILEHPGAHPALSQLQLPGSGWGWHAVRGAVEGIHLRYKLLSGHHELPAAVHALVVQHQGVGFVGHVGLHAVQLSVQSIQGIPGNKEMGARWIHTQNGWEARGLCLCLKS